MRETSTHVDVAVVGGGIAGLTAAYRLKEAGRAPEVFEADSEIGGRMRARKENGWLVEKGTETLASHGYPATWQLIKDVGLDRDGGVLKVGSLAGVWRNGKAHAGSGHWVGILTGAGLSLGSRAAMAGMLGGLLPSLGKVSTRRPGESPLGLRTVAEFVDGKHPDLHDYLLQPAAGTGWAWDIRRSCVAPLVATLVATRLLHGWRTYRDGMDSLARKVAQGLTVHTGRAVQEVTEIHNGGVRLVFADGSVVTAREAVLAVPAPVAGKLYPSAPAGELDFLHATSYSRMIRVTCLFDRPLAVRQARGTMACSTRATGCAGCAAKGCRSNSAARQARWRDTRSTRSCMFRTPPTAAASGTSGSCPPRSPPNWAWPNLSCPGRPSARPSPTWARRSPC
ncbi:protoporphyrinogen/coproporphyrinogen oxidase [Streptomyces sp. NBC_01210]|uniref:protoporphyrinogen/coproporphyrinogen oxidase n=1 Tax=Streptomyces sp. NBC_01210 TaxID=2903774 RepID=UPI002E0FDA2C